MANIIVLNSIGGVDGGGALSPDSEQMKCMTHSAPQNEWTDLYYALKNSPTIANSNVSITLNENGQYITESPARIASYINNGGVWVDWCAWPMYVNDSPQFGAPNLNGAKNFAEFLQAMGGIQVSSNGNSNPNFATPSGATYVRSLTIDQPINSSRFVVNPQTPRESAGGYVLYPSFAILYGKGAYIYAFATYAGFGVFCLWDSQPSPQVTSSQYIPFVNDIVLRVLGEGNASVSPPSCPSFGTYHSQDPSNPLFYQFVDSQNGVTRYTTANSSCTAISTYYSGPSGLDQTQLEQRYAGFSLVGGSTSGSAGGGAQANSGAPGPTYSSGGGTAPGMSQGTMNYCEGIYGQYLGTGPEHGVAEGLYVFQKQTGPNTCTNYVVGANCNYKTQYNHTGTGCLGYGSGGSGGSGSSAGSGSSGGVTQFNVGGGGSSPVSSGSSLPFGLSPVMLAAGALGVGAILYLILDSTTTLTK